MQNASRGLLSLVLLAYTEAPFAQGALRRPPEPPRQVARPTEMSTPAVKPMDVVFARETDLSVVFQHIAQKGKFNVVLDPRVHQRMTITLKSIEPLEALETVAKLNALKIHRILGKRGVTYAITIPEFIEKSICVAYTRAVQVEGVRARDVANQLARGIGRDINISVAIDEHTNKLVLRGTEEALARAAGFIHRYTRRR